MENVRFFSQYLLSPLVLAIVGGFITFNVQSNQRHLEEMKFTEQIIKDAYDTSNPARGMAICLLIRPTLKSNPEYADSLIKSINAFYASRVMQAARNGKIEDIQNIQSSAENVGGPVSVVAKEIKESKVISRTQKAKELESIGFQLLDNNNLGDAKNAFINAENTYPGFHNAYEISRLLIDADKIIQSEPAKKQQEANRVKEIIINKYSGKQDQ